MQALVNSLRHDLYLRVWKEGQEEKAGGTSTAAPPSTLRELLTAVLLHTPALQAAASALLFVAGAGHQLLEMARALCGEGSSDGDSSEEEFQCVVNPWGGTASGQSGSATGPVGVPYSSQVQAEPRGSHSEEQLKGLPWVVAGDVLLAML